MTSKCVYTTLIGGYERLNEQPVRHKSDLPFICLTDDPTLTSQTWDVRRVATLFPSDPVRSQRELKIRPHEYLPEFDQSLYIDNTVLLKAPPEAIFERHAGTAGFAVPLHEFRVTVRDEFAEVVRQEKDDPARMLEQLAAYEADAPDYLEEKPFWSGLLLRDHRRPDVRSAGDIWAAHVLRYSRRDQLSLGLALRAAGVKPTIIDIPVHSSWCHTWPTESARVSRPSQFEATTDLALSMAKQMTLAISAENNALRAQNEAVNAHFDTWSTTRSGRAVIALRELAGRYPRLANIARRCLDLAQGRKRDTP